MRKVWRLTWWLDRGNSAYTAFRASYGYLLALVGYLAGWWVAHHFFGYDPGGGKMDDVLSIDASVAFTLYSIEYAKAERAKLLADRRRDQQLADIEARTASTHALVEAIRALAERIEVAIRHIRDLIERHHTLEVQQLEREEKADEAVRVSLSAIHTLLKAVHDLDEGKA